MNSLDGVNENFYPGALIQVATQIGERWPNAKLTRAREGINNLLIMVDGASVGMIDLHRCELVDWNDQPFFVAAANDPAIGVD
jgi:hypothetical protein